MFFNFYWKGVDLYNKAVFISAVQQTDSVTHLYYPSNYTPFHILYHFQCPHFFWYFLHVPRYLLAVFLIFSFWAIPRVAQSDVQNFEYFSWWINCPFLCVMCCLSLSVLTFALKSLFLLIILDLQHCANVCFTKKQYSFIYMYFFIFFIKFFIFFSIMIYHRILKTIPCAIQ